MDLRNCSMRRRGRSMMGRTLLQQLEGRRLLAHQRNHHPPLPLPLPLQNHHHCHLSYFSQPIPLILPNLWLPADPSCSPSTSKGTSTPTLWASTHHTWGRCVTKRCCRHPRRTLERHHHHCLNPNPNPNRNRNRNQTRKPRPNLNPKLVRTIHRTMTTRDRRAFLTQQRPLRQRPQTIQSTTIMKSQSCCDLLHPLPGPVDPLKMFLPRSAKLVVAKMVSWTRSSLSRTRWFALPSIRVPVSPTRLRAKLSSWNEAAVPSSRNRCTWHKLVPSGCWSGIVPARTTYS